jgi:putative ABC transport system permease protein
MVARIVLASLRARRGRLLLALIAVSLGVSVAVALTTLALEVGDEWARTLRAAGPNFIVLPEGARWTPDLAGAEISPARAGLALDPARIAALKSTFWRNNVLEAAPELEVRATYGEAELPLTGTWFDRSLAIEDGVWRLGSAWLHPGWTVEGRWPRDGEHELAVGRAWAVAHGVHRGDRLDIRAGAKAMSLEVTGIVTSDRREEQRGWVPLEIAQVMSGRPGEADRIWLSALVKAPTRKPPPDPKSDPVGYERYFCTAYPSVVARDLSSAIPGSEVVPMTEIVAGEGAVVRRLNVLMVLLALAALTASVLGLLSTSTAAVVERSAELGLLRAIGAAPRQIATLLATEGFLLALGGGVLGWFFGALAARAIRGDVFGTASTPSPLLLPLALALALIVTAIGTAGSLRLALRIDAARVLRG